MSRALLAEIPDLPIEAFKHVGDKRIKPQGGGGGSQNSNVTQTNISKSAEPYYKQLLKSAGQNIFATDSSGRVTGIKPYEPYAGGDVNARVAGFSPLQQQTQQEIGGMQTPEQFGYATQGAGMGGMLGFNTAQRGLNAAFGNTADYMSPYIQGALNPQIREANLQADYAKRNDALQSMKGGAFGGSRSALMAAERERNANTMVGDILGKGYQSAFDAAQRYQQNLGTLGMQGLQQGLAGSELMGKLGTSQQAADLERLRAQGLAGAEQQGLQQKYLDTAYQQAMEGRDWEKAQLQFYSDMLRGNADALGKRVVKYTNEGNTLSNIVGAGTSLYGAGRQAGYFAEGGEVKGAAGLAGLGLYNVMNKG